VDAIFLAVGAAGLAIDGACGVLTANGGVGYLERVEDANGVQEFDLFIANGLGFEADGGFHGDEGQDLEEVVLRDIAKGSGFLVEGAARADAEFFADGDLDVINGLASPERFEDGV
jgi:hypothetical protein